MKNRIQQQQGSYPRAEIPPKAAATTSFNNNTLAQNGEASSSSSSSSSSLQDEESIPGAAAKEPSAIPSFNVIVIGGGFAGLAAARTLLQQQQQQQQQYSCHVTLLEAKDRWGGRVHSVCLDDDDDYDDCIHKNVYADLGGMFWHGNTTVYQTLAREFPHVESIATGGDSKIPAQEGATWLRHASSSSSSDNNNNNKSTTLTATMGRPQPITTQEIHRSEELYQAWETAMHQRYYQQVGRNNNKFFDDSQTSQLLAQWNDDFCSTLSPTDLDLLKLRLTMSFEMDRGMSWENHTLAGLDQDWDWVDFTGDDVIARHGMQAWVTAVVNDIAHMGGQLLLNQRVNRVEYCCKRGTSNTASCVVTTEKGQVFTADHVVVALPLGVLKHSAGHLFSPPLPALKMDALERAGVGVLNTLLVRWNRPLALPGQSNAYYFLQSKHKGNPLRHGFCCPSHLRQSRNENTVTQFHFSETSHPFDDIEYWKAQAVEIVRDVVAEPLSTSDILVAHVSSWHLDPDIRGAYSAATTRTRGNADRMLLGMSVGRCVYFAGEHTHTGGRYQSLDGAYETGVRAAQEILHVVVSENVTTSVGAAAAAMETEAPRTSALVTVGRTY